MDYYSAYANLPEGTPPPGVVPNFDNPPSRALALYVGMGTCVAVAAVMLALRMYAKFVVTHSPGWDDLACSIGFVILVAQTAVTFAITEPRGPLGRHMWDQTIAQNTRAYFQKTLASFNLYTAATFFIKLSLFLLYIRLFKPNKFTRWLNHGGIITCGLFYSACMIGNCVLFVPTPSQSNDNSGWLLRANESANKLIALSIIQAVFGTLSNIYLLVIPIQMIFQLHFPIKRKIGVSAVFMFGILAIACSLANLVYQVKELATTDHSWTGVSIYIFCSAELSAGIVCSCMPICASLLRGHIPKKFHFPSLWRIYFNFRSRSSQRPFVSDRTHSLDNLQPPKRDSYLEVWSKDYTQLEDGSGREEMKPSVLTQRERLEY